MTDKQIEVLRCEIAKWKYNRRIFGERNKLMTDKQLEVLRCEIAKLEIQPGDVLVFRGDRDLSQEAVEGIISFFQKLNIEVLVIPKDTDLSVLRAQKE